MAAPVAHDVARGMKPLVAAVAHLHTVIDVIRRIAAQILDAARKRGQRAVHVFRMQARTPGFHRIRKVALIAEADHAAEFIRPDRIGDAEIRIDLHVPKSRMNGRVDRPDAELLIINLLVHLVDERIERIGPRLARISFFKGLILLMPLHDSLNRSRQILSVARSGHRCFRAKHQISPPSCTETIVPYQGFSPFPRYIIRY